MIIIFIFVLMFIFKIWKYGKKSFFKFIKKQIKIYVKLKNIISSTFHGIIENKIIMD